MREFSFQTAERRMREALRDTVQAPDEIGAVLDRFLPERAARQTMAGEVDALGPLLARAPQRLKRPGRDVVFLWKQNDSGLFGRRSDMMAKHLLRSGVAGRILHFDAAISLSKLLEVGARSQARTTADHHVYRNVISRWLGLQDEAFQRRRTIIHDEHGRTFMGQELPKPGELAAVIRDALKADNLSEEAILWVCPAQFEFPAFTEAFEFKHVVADLIDDQRAFSGRADYRLALEESYRTVLSAAETVFANCTAVAERFRGYGAAEPIVVSNAAERLNIRREERIDLFPGQDVVRIGYVGNMRDRFDHELVGKLARADDRYRVILVGSTGGNAPVEALGLLGNVTLTGPLTYDEANRVAASFDIAMIPHQVNELTQSMNPLKAYVYQALGLRIVSTNVDNIEGGPDLRIARDDREFLELVAELSRTPKRATRSAPAGPYWDQQIETVRRYL